MIVTTIVILYFTVKKWMVIKLSTTETDLISTLNRIELCFTSY